LTLYDPDAIFGGDSDDDLYDYSDDEGSPCLDYDPGPCSPRPLSQGQPTMEGLRAWNEERGLKFWGRILLTPLSETMITPSYPHFTSLSLTYLNLVPCDASPSSRPTAQENSTYEEGAHTPLTTLDLPHEYQWDYASPTSCESSWDSSGACSCTAEATCCDDTANPTDPPHTPKRPELLSSSYGNPDVGLLVDKTDCNSDLTGDPTAKQFNPSSLSYTEISTRPLNHSTSPLAPTTFLTAMKWTALLPIPLLPPSLPDLLSDPPQPRLDPSSALPAERSMRRRRKQTTMVDRTKRPWLTPPLPSNMAWRGWVLSKISMIITRPSRQPPPSLDFSLSANERSHRRSAQPRHGESKPPLRNTSPLMALKTQWTPRSAARRRLERLRSQQPPLLRSRCKFRQSRNKVGLIFLPLLNIDHPHENKKLEYHTTIDTSITDHLEYNQTTVFPPFINLFDSFPEYKTLMYWEVKAG
jgi:hypothetical protein